MTGRKKTEVMKYETVKKKCDDKSSVWHYFLRAEDGQSGKCKLCQKIIQSHGGSTTGLRVHLKSAHVIDLSSNSEKNKDSIIHPSTSLTSATLTQKTDSCPTSIEPIIAKKRKVTDYFQSSHSMEATVSRMVALDGIAFSVFCTSDDLRRLFNNSGYDKLPKTPRGIKNIVMNYSKQEKKKLVAELQQISKSGKKFALSFDEWTSTRNARYINVNIHCGDEFADGSNFKNLGLVRIDGSMPAETCIRLLKVKLAEFEVSLDGDIVAITTDGASVMCKVGRSLHAFHQVCLAHGIQLAVTDVLYKKSRDIEDMEFVQSQNNVENDFEEDVTVDDNDVNNSNDEDGGFEIEPVESMLYALNPSYKSVINKVRTVVKIFKNSPVKNDMFLQKHVKQDLGKELQLLADCKTRWGSIATMLERFNRLRSCVSKALIDMKSDIKFTHTEFEMLDSIQNSLSVIKITVEALCRRDASLLTADTAMKFMLRKLDQQNTSLSRLLASSLRERIYQRRLSVATILQYLHNPDTYFNEIATDEFPKLTNSEMVEEIYAIIQRFESEPAPNTPVEDNLTVDSTNTSGDSEIIDIEKELNKEIEKSLKEKSLQNKRSENDGESETDGGMENDKRKIIRIEMALFENGGNRGLHLEKAYKYFLTIPPTSVESERAFSSAAYTCNKIRSSLKDDTLDALCFLRSLLQAQKKNAR